MHISRCPCIQSTFFEFVGNLWLCRNNIYAKRLEIGGFARARTLQKNSSTCFCKSAIDGRIPKQGCGIDPRNYTVKPGPPKLTCVHHF